LVDSFDWLSNKTIPQMIFTKTKKKYNLSNKRFLLAVKKQLYLLDISGINIKVW